MMLGQYPELVLFDLDLDRRAPLAPVGNELIDGDWVNYGARENMSADL